MAFYGLDFMYDDRHSSEFGVKISSIGGGGVSESSAGSITTIFSDVIYRKPTAYFYGTSNMEVLTFDISIMSENTIAGHYRSKIVNWLSGKGEYKKLRIVQNDLQFLYFNCIITDITSIYVGNLCKGFSLAVECDAPWAWELPSVIEYTNTSDQFDFNIYNDSDASLYTYPILEITMPNNNTDVYIENITNNNRKTSFVSLQPNEKIIIDNNIQSIKSYIFDSISQTYKESGLLRSENFNKKFFYLVPMLNNIRIVGRLANIKITYNNARKVGG